jgi:phenylacetate-CoA ligase
MNDGTTNPLETESKLESLIEFASEKFDFYKNCTKFSDCPIINKQNYIEKFDIQQRTVDMKKVDFIHSSSGSTGSPTIWPRSRQDEQAISALFERILVSFGLNTEDAKNTLAVVCFPMSVWVGGLFTTFCLRILSDKGYPLTIVTPGNNVDETFKILRSVSNMTSFKQTVIFGYPPFVKGMIDKGKSVGIDWDSFNLDLVLAGEFQSMALQMLELSQARTPFSIKIRQFLASRPDLARELFKSDRFPSFF